MSEDLALVEDAEFRPVAQTQEPRGFSADKMLADHREVERFKSEALGEDDWHRMKDKRGNVTIVPKANSLHKLYPAFGISFEFISKDEDGQPGVRRSIVENIDGSRSLLYKCTIRGRDRFGRTVEKTSSLEPSEVQGQQPDNGYRARCETRCQRRIATVLVGGVEYEDDETGNNRRNFQNDKGRQTPVRVTINELSTLFEQAGIEGKLGPWLVANVGLKGTHLTDEQSVLAKEKLLAIVPPDETPKDVKPMSDGQKSLLFLLHTELGQTTDEARYAFYASLKLPASSKEFTSEHARIAIDALHLQKAKAS